MALKLNSIKREVAKDGEWVDITEWPGVRLKVRSINSRDYQIDREMLVQKLTRQLGRFPTSPEMEPALGKLIARRILRDWDGVIVGDGEAPTPYSAEAALELLSDPEMLAFEQQVIWAASRVGERDAEFTPDAVKNSEQPSATT